MKKLKFLLAPLALTLALPAAAQGPVGQTSIAANSTLLSITAQGKSTRTPDLAVFNAGVVTRDERQINRTVKFPDAAVAGEPITSYASSSTGASAYRQLAKEVLTRVEAVDFFVADWELRLDLGVRTCWYVRMVM